MKRLCQLLLLFAGVGVGLFVPGTLAQEGEATGQIFPLPEEGILAVNGRFLHPQYPHYLNQTDDLVLYDAQTGELLHTWPNNTGDNRISLEAISRNNRYIAFSSDDSYYVYDRETEQTTLIISDGSYNKIALSNQGDVVFTIEEYSEEDGVFIANIHTDESPLRIADFSANQIVVSANGRYSAFIGNNDTDDLPLLLYDQQNGLFQIAPDILHLGISMSADGRYITFTSDDDTLVSYDTNATSDVFLFDQQTGNVNRISISSTGQQANGHSGDSFVSDDGRYVAFESDASNLVANDENGNRDVFLHDRQTSQTILISQTPHHHSGNVGSYFETISSDGQYVYFDGANNLINHNEYDADVLLTGYFSLRSVYDRRALPDDAPWVSGRIVDTNGFGLSDTLISVDGHPTTTTDQNGNYILVGLAPGNHTITASREQYTSVTPPLAINLVENNIAKQNIVLQFEDIHEGKLRAISTDQNGQPNTGVAPCMNNKHIAYAGFSKGEQHQEIATLYTKDLIEDSTPMPIYRNQESLHEYFLKCLAISTDGRFTLFLAGNDSWGFLTVYDKQSKQTTPITETIEGWPAMSNNGHYIASYGVNEQDGVVVSIYNILTNELHQEVPIFLDDDFPIDISLDAQYIVGIEENTPGNILLYDVANEYTDRITTDGVIADIEISDDGQRYCQMLWIGHFKQRPPQAC